MKRCRGRYDSIRDKAKDVELENTRALVRRLIILVIALASFPAVFK